MEYSCLTQQFAKIVQKTPDSDAIVFEEKKWTYLYLSTVANYISEKICIALPHLNKQVSIGLYLEDIPTIVASMLASLKLRGIFIPLCPDLPPKRIEMMLNSVQPEVIVTTQGHHKKIHSIISANKLETKIVLIASNIASSQPSRKLVFPSSCQEDEERLCYIYFTSGSSGKPKPITGSLKALNHFLNWEKKTLEVQAKAHFSQLIHFNFDPFLRDIFVPLISGGAICVPPEKLVRLSPLKLTTWLKECNIQFIHTVPSFLRNIMQRTDQNFHLPDLQYILLCGEQVFPEDIKRWMSIFGENVKFVNLYGPSETTMAKFAYFIEKEDQNKSFIPIGKPIHKTQAFVVDEKGQLCPEGQIGELLIFPPFKLSGYYRLVEENKKSFIQNPFSQKKGEIIYKTGDLVRLLEDKNYQFISRKDHQIKLRGIRIELAEIENVIRKFIDITDVLVLTSSHPHDSNEDLLIAYVVFKKKSEVDQVKSLETFLQSFLPNYMMPHRIFKYKSFPCLPNGKIDIQSLKKSLLI